MYRASGSGRVLSLLQALITTSVINTASADSSKSLERREERHSGVISHPAKMTATANGNIRGRKMLKAGSFWSKTQLSLF